MSVISFRSEKNTEKFIQEYGRKDYDNFRALVYVAKSDIALKKQDYKVAESTLRTALELNPANTSFTLKLARVVHKSGRFDEAIQILIAWQKKCPDDACREQTAKAIEHERNIEAMLQRLSKS